MRRLWLRAMLLSWAALLARGPAWAGDEGDIYAFALIGQHLRTGAGQGTVGAGYCFWNSWGLGPVFDQISSHYNASVEGRYFFEPFETSVGVGFSSRRDAEQRIIYHPLFTASAAYLMALTSSLAFKFESKGQFLWKDRGSLFLGIGMRWLY